MLQNDSGIYIRGMFLKIIIIEIKLPIKAVEAVKFFISNGSIQKINPGRKDQSMV